MLTTSPKKVTGQVLKFCATINAESSPELIIVETQDFAQVGNCHKDVRRLVSEKGGEIVFGWIIWQCGQFMIEAEHHAAYRKSDGKLVDISPRPDGEKFIMFLPDPTAPYDYDNLKLVRSHRQTLTENSVTKAFIKAASELDDLKEKYFNPEYKGVNAWEIPEREMLFFQEKHQSIIKAFDKMIKSHR